MESEETYKNYQVQNMESKQKHISEQILGVRLETGIVLRSLDPNNGQQKEKILI